MGCQLSVEEASYLAVNELGLDEADLQGWQLKEDHIECLGLVSKAHARICGQLLKDRSKF